MRIGCGGTHPSTQREVGSCCSKASPKLDMSQLKQNTIRIKGDISFQELRISQRSKKKRIPQRSSSDNTDNIQPLYI